MNIGSLYGVTPEQLAQYYLGHGSASGNTSASLAGSSGLNFGGLGFSDWLDKYKKKTTASPYSATTTGTQQSSSGTNSDGLYTIDGAEGEDQQPAVDWSKYSPEVFAGIAERLRGPQERRKDWLNDPEKPYTRPLTAEEKARRDSFETPWYLRPDHGTEGQSGSISSPPSSPAPSYSDEWLALHPELVGHSPQENTPDNKTGAGQVPNPYGLSSTQTRRRNTLGNPYGGAAGGATGGTDYTGPDANTDASQSSNVGNLTDEQYWDAYLAQIQNANYYQQQQAQYNAQLNGWQQQNQNQYNAALQNAQLQAQGALQTQSLQAQASQAAAAARNAIANQAAGYMTEAQRDQSLGFFDPSQKKYAEFMQTGGYSDADKESILAAQNANIASQTKAMQQNINNALSARGLGGNPLAAAALGMAGQFAGGAARGQASAALNAQQVANRLAATQGSASNASAMGSIASRPTQESAAGMMGSVKQGTVNSASMPTINTQGWSGAPSGNIGQPTNTNPFSANQTASQASQATSGDHVGGGGMNALGSRNKKSNPYGQTYRWWA